MNPTEGLTLKTAGGQFRGHMDPNGNGLFAGNVGVAGNLNVGGTLSKASGSFKIDHPLDPANRYLYHSFVESPDMMNIYNGNTTLDDAGEAVVELPA
jgi:trimeric autotransporter adhesin